MQKSKHQQKIEEFKLKAGQIVNSVPTIPPEDQIKLGLKLILEEFQELVQAAGYYLESGIADDTAELKVVKNYEIVSANPSIPPQPSKVDLVKVADGLGDLSVVVNGLASTFGINMKPLLKLIDENNLEKFGDGHYIRADGKLVKPPDHKPPDIEQVLLNQGWKRDN